MSHVTRKRVFGVYDQLRLKPACSADETSKNFFLFDVVVSYDFCFVTFFTTLLYI